MDDIRFSGLAVAEYGDAVHAFVVDGVEVTVYEKTLDLGAGRKAAVFTVQPGRPIRFRMDLLVPEDARNACLTLNGDRLLDWFAGAPERPDIGRDACSEAACGAPCEAPCEDGGEAACGSCSPGGSCCGCGGGSPSGDDDGTAIVSTLRPGRFQSISFRWEPGDRLRLEWIGASGT